jgi:tetratricopeptide (TPR) repeat protein
MTPPSRNRARTGRRTGWAALRPVRAFFPAAVLAFASGCGRDAGAPPGAEPHAEAPAAVPGAPAPAAAPPREPADPRLDDALRRIAGGDFEGARALAGTVLEERPDSARAVFLVGLAHHKQKNYGAAAPCFDRALELGPTFEPFAPVTYFRAWCRYNLGDAAGARADFEAHLRLVPDEADSYFGLGVVALDEGRLADAERELRRSLQLSTERVERGDESRRADAAKARARLSDVYLLRDDPQAARLELEAAVELYPAHYTAWYKLHQVLLRLREDDAAAAALRQHDLWKERVRPGSEGLGG